MGDPRADQTPALPLFPGLKTTDRAVREEILHRAYQIWQREGHPSDRALDHWLQAEANIRSRA